MVDQIDHVLVRQATLYFQYSPVNLQVNPGRACGVSLILTRIEYNSKKLVKMYVKDYLPHGYNVVWTFWVSPSFVPPDLAQLGQDFGPRPDSKFKYTQFTMNVSGPQPYQPYSRARRIEYNAFLHSSLRQNPHLFLPTPQDVCNPARLVYQPDPSTLHPVGKVKDRDYWLTIFIHNLPKAWLRRLETPLVPSSTGLRCFQLYPLQRHQAILSKWNMDHPGECYPCEVRWNLNNLRGDVEDDCHPPYYLLTLIAAAINGSPDARATSKEIRLTIMLRYNHFITRSTLSGCFRKLRGAVARLIADTAHNLPPPPLPIEPSVHLNHPKELDPRRTIKTGPSSHSGPQERPRRLDVDQIKAGQRHIPQEEMDRLMRQEGRNLVQDWEANR
ncbi:hypothetical protein Clacol_003359 [Clathrus columnatus]|uniref:Uncharacterized protein n=1 Tax=Clathrus columnatus TaxID=1419009 RepID=A0AAV5A3E9_9AGAM|nr:hypothetical protein Clacol_003359 [Clathrus columnatus]